MSSTSSAQTDDCPRGSIQPRIIDGQSYILYPRPCALLQARRNAQFGAYRDYAAALERQNTRMDSIAAAMRRQTLLWQQTAAQGELAEEAMQGRIQMLEASLSARERAMRRQKVRLWAERSGMLALLVYLAVR